MKYTCEQLARMIDHSLLHPTMTDQELEDGCKLAAKYGVASVCLEVEDDTFGKTLEGRKRALRVAGNVLRPFMGAS